MEVEHEAESVFRRKEMLSSWVHPELKFLSHQRLPMLFFHLEGRGWDRNHFRIFLFCNTGEFCFFKKIHRYVYIFLIFFLRDSLY